MTPQEAKKVLLVIDGIAIISSEHLHNPLKWISATFNPIKQEFGDGRMKTIGAITLTPERAWDSGFDAANAQMRKACRKKWNRDDYNKAVEVQARFLRYLGHPYDKVALNMMEPVSI